MSEPVWIRKEALLALHARSLALHGGAEGVRDESLLESALMRPVNRFQYEGTVDPCVLAATYAVAMSANHPFVDGNKRAALTCLLLFLAENGLRLRADRVETTRVMVSVAAGDIDIDALAAWVSANSSPA